MQTPFLKMQTLTFIVQNSTSLLENGYRHTLSTG